ncbi:MAG: hypothetical protein CMJ18_11120 [Phycisphaeraceae bacterium]|nr:hypothetical protein [Phycisphaeraceae bacterium]
MARSHAGIEPGQRIVLTHQIPLRDGVWSTRVVGVVETYEQRKTGSWYAHGKDDRLWLDRLVLRKDDGEQVVCNLDRYSHVELLPAPAGNGAPPAAEAAGDAAS